MKLFLQKKCKILERLGAGGGWGRGERLAAGRAAGGCLRRLGALPPNPQPPAAGGFAPKPPLASGGWGLRPQTPKTAPPIASFWLRAWLCSLWIRTLVLALDVRVNSTTSVPLKLRRESLRDRKHQLENQLLQSLVHVLLWYARVFYMVKCNRNVI